MPEYKVKQKKDFKDLVLEHLEKILDISTKEFTGGYWKTIDHGNWKEKVYVPDQRKCYIQAVESFSDLLFPHFDKQMPDDCKEIETQLESLLKEYEDEKIEQEKYVIKKTRLIRKLFRILNLFLERKKYFIKRGGFG